MSSLQGKSQVLDLLVELETARNNELIRVQKTLLDLQVDYETKKMNLLKTNKEDFLRLEDARKILRKELKNFPRTTIPKIYSALIECKLPENLIHSWLEDVSKFYLNDVNLSLKMLSTDMGETTKELFEQVTEFYKKEFIETNQRESAHIQKIIEKQVDKEIHAIMAQ